MMSSVPEAAHDPRPPETISCGTCGRLARLAVAEICCDRDRRKHECTYKCHSCGTETSRETANIGLPQLASIRCEECGWTARFCFAEISGDAAQIKEQFIYECFSCGAETRRAVNTEWIVSVSDRPAKMTAF